LIQIKSSSVAVRNDGGPLLPTLISRVNLGWLKAGQAEERTAPGNSKNACGNAGRLPAAHLAHRG